MPSYLVAQVSVDDPEAYQRYTALSGPLIQRFGGKFVVRGGDTLTLEGPSYEKRLVIVEFESHAQLKAFYDSPEYQEARKLREICSEAQFIAVETEWAEV